MPEFNVRDKVFFITGGASGIGRGLAEGVLARQGKVRDKLNRDGSRNDSNNISKKKKKKQGRQQPTTQLMTIQVWVNNQKLS